MPDQALPDPRRWRILGLLCAAQFLVILDTSIIGVALPDIQRSLGFSADGLQWVFNAYVIAFGGLLLLGGRMSDILGPRRVFLAGLTVLSVASLAAGVAASDWFLIAARAAQGVGAALAAPAALSAVMRLFTDPRELGRAMGFWGASAPAGGTAGVVLGGVITQWIGWRWVFLVNVPVGIIVLGLTAALLHRDRGAHGRIDVAGAVLATAALVTTVYGLVTANVAGWTSPRFIGVLSGAVVLLGALVIVERAQAHPLVPPQIFRVQNLAAGNGVMALLGAAWIPLWFFLNLYLQEVLRLSPIRGGLALAPMTILIMVLMVGVTGRIIARFGFKVPMVAGLGLLAISLGLLARAPADGTFARDVLPASLLAAAGMSLTYIPVLVAGISAARPAEVGLASGLINTSYQAGSALGLAAVTALATWATSRSSSATSLQAMTDGFHAAFLGSGITAVAAGALGVVAIRTRGAGAQEAASDRESGQVAA